MSAQDQATKTMVVDQNTNLTELGGIIFTEVVLSFEMSTPDGSGTEQVQVLANLTCRAFTPAEAAEKLAEAIDGVFIRPAQHKLVQAYRQGQQPEQPHKTAQVTDEAAAPKAPATPAAPAAGAAKPNVPVSPTAPGGSQSIYKFFVAARMEVQPKADGKVVVQFYDDNPNHKFPELKATWSMERAKNLLGPTKDRWDETTLKQAGIYNVSYRVWWKNSDKLNTAGNPFKDVVKVELSTDPMPTGEHPQSGGNKPHSQDDDDLRYLNM
jgi:hypothetical protein